MKIACIGNMNNFMFNLVRLLRDEKHDAHLLLLNEESHFMPEADSFSDDYKSYTHQLSWWPKTPPGNGMWTNVTPQQIKADLKPYDVLIGCGYGPAFAEYAGLKLDLFIPYGSDLYELPFMKYWPQKVNTINNLYPLLQKKGIEKTKFVVYDYTKEQESVFEKFNLKGKRKFIYPPVFYTKDYNKSEISRFYSKSVLYPVLKKLREENDLLIIQHSRQSWKNPEDIYSNKRNDILIQSFKTFVTGNPDIKAKLILLEYGIDVEETKNLARSLEISDKIHWLPKSYRKELFVAISLCDIGVGELGMSFLMYGAIGEFMAMELPFIHNCNSKDYEGKYETLYENNHADSEETLLAHFESYLKNKEAYVQRAAISKEWLLRFIINEPLAKITELIKISHKKTWLQKIMN